MNSCTLLLGTADGLRIIEFGTRSDPTILAEGVRGNAVRGIAVDPTDPATVYVAAGLRGWGLHVSRDGGRSWTSLGFEEQWVWDIAVDHSNPERLLVGTEPPMLYETCDRGHTFRDFPGIDEVESRACWTFFHAPFYAGHLHGIAISPKRPDRIVVGVEHGGLLLSEDRGESWRDVMPGADLHRVTIDPIDPDRIYAGTGNGLFLSEDGGRSWAPFDGLRGRYVHGIQIDHRDTARIFVYVDSSRCPIYRTSDAGESWDEVGTGLPSSRPADPIRLHPDEPDVVFYAGDSENGSDLYVSDDGGDTWSRLGLELPKVWRLQAISA